MTANRLLKFEFPVSRNPDVYERLLKTHLQSPGLSKRLVEDLPLFLMERLYGALWRHALPEHSRLEPWNRLLSLTLLAEQLLEFKPDELVRQDIARLGAQMHPSLPSYYFNGQTDRETLRTVLARNHYQTVLTQSAPEESLLTAYGADRLLSNPLPWAQLLEALDEEVISGYPRLHRLWLILRELKAKHDDLLDTEPLKAITRIQTLLQTDWTEISRESGRSRPVQVLVLVEGETEKLLLPIFAETMNIHFHALGVYVLPSGGKNQMLALYQKFRPILNVPIFVILDRDAAETAATLRPILRAEDVICELAEGEFEDMYEMDLILKTLNRVYDPYPRLTASLYREHLQPPPEASGFIPPVGRVQELRHLWKVLDLGAFDKTLFATQLGETVRLRGTEPAQPIRRLINRILEVRAHAPAASE